MTTQSLAKLLSVTAGFHEPIQLHSTHTASGDGRNLLGRIWGKIIMHPKFRFSDWSEALISDPSLGKWLRRILGQEDDAQMGAEPCLPGAAAPAAG